MDNDYHYKLSALNPKVAIIQLKEQVLGGNDAMYFSSKLEEIATKGVNFVIADLSAVSLMNSSGLGMMVAGLSTLRKYKINFVLASVPDKVNSLLEMTHLNKVFKIYVSVDAAEKVCAQSC